MHLGCDKISPISVYKFITNLADERIL